MVESTLLHKAVKNLLQNPVRAKTPDSKPRQSQVKLWLMDLPSTV